MSRVLANLNSFSQLTYASMILYEVYDSQSFLTTLLISFAVRSYIENTARQPTVFWGQCVSLLVFLIVFGIGVSRALGTAKRQLYEMTESLQGFLVEEPGFNFFHLFFSFSFDNSRVPT